MGGGLRHGGGCIMAMGQTCTLCHGSYCPRPQSCINEGERVLHRGGVGGAASKVLQMALLGRAYMHRCLHWQMHASVHDGAHGSLQEGWCHQNVVEHLTRNSGRSGATIKARMLPRNFNRHSRIPAAPLSLKHFFPASPKPLHFSPAPLRPPPSQHDPPLSP